MSKNIDQVFIANPITSNASTDLMYFGQSPYGAGNDAAMTYANFSAQFGAPYTAAALTAANDTNVTLTLGGTPATSLLHAASITAGWTGTLSGTRGGTGVNNGTNTATFAGNLSFANSFTTSGNFAVTQTYTGTTNVTFPTSGTLATTSQLVTPAALTEVNDTNVTLTLGGSPSTALVNAASITAGWTGQLSLARGGTNANLTASNGGIFYSTASAGAILSGTATATQMLQSGASTTPAWSTTTWPATSTINQILYSSSANTIAGLATANSGVLVTSSGGVPSISTTLPSGIAATNMSLTTPSLGVATATSINFGNGALSAYAPGGSWTPADGSGASLSFTGVSASYTLIGNMVFAYCQLTYPSTVSGSNAVISGLPFQVSNNNYATQGILSFSSTANANKAVAAGGTQTVKIYTTAGVQTTNVQLTGATINLLLIYPVS